MQTTLRFEYKFSVQNAALMVFACLAVTISIGFIAYTNPNIGISRMLSKFLSPNAPVLFFWIVFLICLLATIFALVFAVKSFNTLKFVELGPSFVVLPSASVTMSPISIPYSTISQVQVVNIQNQQIAVISSTIGEARLLSKFFATSDSFEAFLLELKQRRHS
jgi:hypothetical protein